MKKLFSPLRTPLLLVALALVGLLGPRPAHAQEEAAEAYGRAYDLVLDERWSAADSALARFSEGYPESGWADDARYWHCYATERQHRTSEQAFECYQDFVEAHPRSKWADDAESELVRIGQRLVQAGQPQYGALIRPYQEDADEEVALAALFALQNIGDERALATILDLYDRTENERLRERIVHSLSQFDAPEATEKLVEIVRNDRSWSVRRSAIHALGNREDEAAAEALKEIARSGRVDVRKAAVFALGNMDFPDVDSYLGEVAQTAEDQEIGEAAVFALGNMEGEAAATALVGVLQEAELAKVRLAALHALGDRDDEGTLDVLRDVALGDSSSASRSVAVLALGKHESDEAVSALREVFASTEDATVRRAVLVAFSMAGRREEGRTEVHDFLKEVAISEGDVDLAETALQGLVISLPEEERLAVFLDVLRRTPYPQVQRAAALRIGVDGGRVAAERLGEVAKGDRAPELRLAAVHALGLSESDDAVPVLIDVAREAPDVRVRTAAVQALGRISTPAAQEALLDILQGQTGGADDPEEDGGEGQEENG